MTENKTKNTSKAFFAAGSSREKRKLFKSGIAKNSTKYAVTYQNAENDTGKTISCSAGKDAFIFKPQI